MISNEDDWAEESPHVCPGCHAVGEEPCAPGCIDAEIQEDNEERRRRARECQCGWCAECTELDWP